MDERFATNLSWYYHAIPFITAILGLIIGNVLVQDNGPFLKTIFPSICLIIGGYGGLIVLGEISEKKK
tara:strand:+ start:330 stop:533 length:204 start_codon:yes stop_codon:yes gene_type:complete